jgi:hypothetical protein
MEVHLQSARSQPKTTEPAIDKASPKKLHKMVSMKNHWQLRRNYRTTTALHKCSIEILKPFAAFQKPRAYLNL